MFSLVEENVRDEVAQYELSRYIDTNEAFWSILFMKGILQSNSLQFILKMV